MEKNNKTAEEIAREYALTLIDEQFVDGSPALNCAIWGIKKGIELQSSDKDERIKELEKQVERYRNALVLIRDWDDDIETEHGDPGEIAIAALKI